MNYTITTLTSRTHAKNLKNHQWPKLIQVSIMMLNCHAQNEVKKSCHSEDILYRRIKQSYWLRELYMQTSRTRLLNCLKWLNQFAVSTDAYPHVKNQHHCPIQSWHIADLILKTTFGLHNEWTESYRWTVVCLITSKKSNS